MSADPVQTCSICLGAVAPGSGELVPLEDLRLHAVARKAADEATAAFGFPPRAVRICDECAGCEAVVGGVPCPEFGTNVLVMQRPDGPYYAALCDAHKALVGEHHRVVPLDPRAEGVSG